MRMISVIGSSDDEEASSQLAEELGRAIRREGWGIVCGGRGGVMEAVCRGFASERGPGVAVGILPSANRADANPHVDVVVPSGLGLARNALVVLTGHAVVAIGGGSGTLCEMAYAWQYGRPLIALVPGGGYGAELAGRRIDGRRADTVVAAQDVDAVMDHLRALAAG